MPFWIKAIFRFLIAFSVSETPTLSDGLDGKEMFVVNKEDQLACQLIKENTIYEIRDVVDLKGDSIIIPSGCILFFNGGSITNGCIKGQDTRIIAGVQKLFEPDVDICGCWNVSVAYPEWFGAAGDGKTDDTESIRKAFLVAANNRIEFQNKTYIINVLAGTSNDSQRIIFPGLQCSEMIGNRTVIKLGDEDNCNLYANKGFGAIFSIYTIDSFYARGITFDFNYKKNPIYQTLNVRQNIQENTQLNAFQFRRVRKVVIECCTFKGHSGTNCIDYNDARYDVGDKTFEITIDSCKFLNCGSKSFFKKGSSYVDAYHDCSTIAIHYRGNNHNTPFVVTITDNVFEGNGGNAYNVVETDASELNFSGNTIKKFTSGIFPCSAIYNSKINIYNNTFEDVSRAIVLWLRNGDDTDSDKYGYDDLSICNNRCTINMGYWSNQLRYDNIGSLKSDRYGFVLTTAGNNKSVKNVRIANNTVRYTRLKDIPKAVCSKASISFESVDSNVKKMKCDRMIVSNNSFYNAVNRILHNSMFQEIDTLEFSGNYIDNPFSVVAAQSSDGGGVVYLNASKAYAPSLDYPTISNFTAIGNEIRYDGYKQNDGCSVIVNTQIRGLDHNTNNRLTVKENKCSSLPQYGAARFTSQHTLFDRVEVEEIMK